MLLLQDFFSVRPVKKAYLFGSYARNEADKNSDLDILVELDHSSPIGMKFFGYQVELEDLIKLCRYASQQIGRSGYRHLPKA